MRTAAVKLTRLDGTVLIVGTIMVPDVLDRIRIEIGAVQAGGFEWSASRADEIEGPLVVTVSLP